MKNIRIEHNGLVLDIPANELAEQLANQNLTPQTLWTPITGEESLPKDDEALCVLAKYTFKGELRTTPVEKVGFFKGMFPLNEFQFYTILQLPVK